MSPTLQHNDVADHPRRSRLRYLGCGLLLLLAACGGTSDPTGVETPDGLDVTPVALNAECDASLSDTRTIMEANVGVELTDTLRAELRDSLEQPYLKCSIFEFRWFAESELRTWSETLTGLDEGGVGEFEPVGSGS